MLCIYYFQALLQLSYITKLQQQKSTPSYISQIFITDSFRKTVNQQQLAKSLVPNNVQLHIYFDVFDIVFALSITIFIITQHSYNNSTMLQLTCTTDNTEINTCPLKIILQMPHLLSISLFLIIQQLSKNLQDCVMCARP